MSKVLIKNGQVVFLDKTEQIDILIENNLISKIEKNINVVDSDVTIIDASQKTVMAGFVDIHTHLREPGFTQKEDIESGARAAVKGGITTLACMPNTKPVIDNTITLEYVVNKTKQACAKVYPIVSATKNQEGKELTDYEKLKKLGACAISDDGKPITNLRVLKNILEYAKEAGILLISHSEDTDLSDGGDVNEGYSSTLCGLKGIPRAAEDSAVARELALAESLGARIHIAHISTKGSVALVREAKKRGVNVTTETCPHYFSLTDECVTNYNTDTKVNPPIREKEDVLAIIDALKDGTIDCIVTDHAPHHIDDKNCEYRLAAFGISGLETSFSVAYTFLVKTGHLSINQLSKLMTKNPSNLLNIGTSEIKVGNIADLVIIDLDNEYVVKKQDFVSNGKNTPFDGYKLYGVVEKTIVDGEIKYTKK